MQAPEVLVPPFPRLPDMARALREAETFNDDTAIEAQALAKAAGAPLTVQDPLQDAFDVACNSAMDEVSEQTPAVVLRSDAHFGANGGDPCRGALAYARLYRQPSDGSPEPLGLILGTDPEEHWTAGVVLTRRMVREFFDWCERIGFLNPAEDAGPEPAEEVDVLYSSLGAIARANGGPIEAQSPEEFCASHGLPVPPAA